MNTFLQASKSCLNNLDQYNTVRVVLGNPTCDLDSAVCALVYAFHHYTKIGENTSEIATIPVFNIPKSEFRLKTEVLYHFESHNVPLELLTFRDQLDLDILSNKGKLEIVLVDQHTLPEKDKCLVDSVVEIVDHRPQDPEWLWPGKIINLQIVGSCATLVAKTLLETNSKILYPVICGLLRGPILVDTANFSKQANKATACDVEVIDKLERIGSITSDREQEYKAILFARTDISRLSPSDLLIKDLKATNDIPIPGLPMLVQNFLKIDGAFEALADFTARYKYSVTVVMGLDLSNDSVARDIAIFSLSPNKLYSTIIKKLQESTDPELRLTEVQGSSEHSEHNWTLLKSGNLQASRKQVLPIITSISVNCLCDEYEKS